MKATQTASSVVAVAAFALCSGGCSRSVQMYVRNDCPFAVSVHERTEWRYGSRMNDRDRVMPQGVFLITEMGLAESAHLQVVDSEGKFLSRVTVNAATVAAAYWDHDEIFVEVKPGQSSVVLENSERASASTGSWRTLGIVAVVLTAVLIAFRSWQKRM